MKQCINIWLVFVLFASYLYSICYCHLPPSLGDVWSEIYLFSNIKRDFFGSVSRISSQLLFCISCPSVMRFAVSGINKQSGGSGNITECKSQGPKLICARFGDLGGSYICTVLSWLGRGYGWEGQTPGTTCCSSPCLNRVYIKRLCLKTYHILEEEGTWGSPTLQWD